MRDDRLTPRAPRGRAVDARDRRADADGVRSESRTARDRSGNDERSMSRMDEQSQMDAPVSDTHAECVQRIAELEAKWKRAVADGMNREKEMQREREEFAKYCTVDLIRDLLPIGDALRAAGDDHGTLRKLFDDFLKKHGVEPVGAAGER